MAFYFDTFILDPEKFSLLSGDTPVAIEPRVFSVLVYLIENQDRIISKDELIEKLWKGSVVSDMALNTCIKSARKALDDNGKQQKYIRTLPKRGFQFIGNVTEQEALSSSNQSEKSQPEKKKAGILMRKMIIASLVLAVGLVWLSGLWKSEQTVNTTTQGKTSIAILNFKQAEEDVQKQFFTEGLTEEIASSLSLYRDLFVIARNSSAQYNEAKQSVKKIGEELGAEYIVDGTVRYQGEAIKISTNLVKAATGQLVWSGSFDQQRAQLYDLKNELAFQIAGRLVPAMVRADAEKNQKKPPEDMDAWAFYHKARSTQAVYSKVNQSEAIHWSNMALEKDADFAAAYGVIARAKGVQFFYQWTDDAQKTLTEAISYAEKAIGMDPNDPGAYAALGYVYRYTGDETLAINNLERAAALNPSDANIRLELAHTLDWFRYQAKALPQINRAIKLSPRDPRLQNMYFYKAHILFHLKDFEGALEATRGMSAALTTDTWRMYYYLIRAANFAQLNQLKAAKQNIQSALVINPKLSIVAMKKKFEGSRNHPENRLFWLASLAKAGLPD